jgi:hypothetical protein
MKAKRTPHERFAGLPAFHFAPHHTEDRGPGPARVVADRIADSPA